MNRLYFDNAATSFPKPEAVYRAVESQMRHVGVSIGRGGYGRAVTGAAMLTRCRSRLAELFRAEGPERFIFGYNGTDVLNQALHGLLKEGDRVLTTALEHNSVRRPLRDLQDRLGVQVVVAAATPLGTVTIDEFQRKLECRPRLVVITHASNVSGALLPISEMVALAKQSGSLLLLDASQSAGHIPIDLRQTPIDLLACSGHKGLLGPLGTGVLYLRPGMEDFVRPIRQGGTGSASEDELQPKLLPDRYESGNHNALGLAGLEAGVEYVLEQTPTRIHQHESQLVAEFFDGLSGVEGARIHGPGPSESRVGVMSVTLDGWDPHDLSAILDEQFGIEARAGLHCSPGAHQALGTFQDGGTLRFSVGAFTTSAEIQQLVEALRSIAEVVG